MSLAMSPANTDDQVLAINLTADDYQALASFRLYLRRFMTFSERITEAAGVGPSQYQALLAIRVLGEDGLVTPSLLAEQLCLKLNSVVELIDRLVDAGHVSRARVAVDRRVTALSLTDEGATVLATLAGRHLEHHRAHATDLIRGMVHLID